MAQSLLHPNVGVTWTSPYYRLIRYSDLKIPNSTTGALATDTAWADSGFDLTLDTDAGVYPFDLPVTVVEECSTGLWKIMIYEKAGSDYASTDTFLGSIDAANSEFVNSIFLYPPSHGRLRR